MGDYQGSQAFAQTPGSTESVTRNTGSLNYSVPLVELRGVVQAVDLTLLLTYSAGISGNFGLPQNWTFGIPYVIPHKSVTTQGRTYVIDAQWADATGYQSGLRYINNWGMLFEQQSPPQDLPSGNPGQYGWSFRYTDGAIDYFDPNGKLLEHDDIHGNYIYYNYLDPNANPQTARLDFIQDSWKQQIKFGYEPGATIYVTGPNDDQITISYGSYGVSQVQWPVDFVTSFDYIQVASRTVISSVQQSSGLQSKFTYQTLDYYDSSNDKQSLPAIQDHYHLDANDNFLSQTNYQFGTASSGRTFTGYAIQKQMGSSSDGLMDSGSSGYEYDTLILNVDANNNTISATRIMYNYLHLPLVENHYAVDQAGYIADTFRAINTYVVDNQHARTPNYTSPTQVEHFNWNPTSQIWQKLRQANTKSDNYGCVTYSDQSLWNTQQGAYVLQQSKTSTYTQASWGGQMLSSDTYVDAITGFSKQLTYGLTPDQKNVASMITSYRSGKASQFIPWKVKNSNYDGQGRVTSETVAWADASSAPVGTVQSYTNENQYTFDSAKNHLIVTAVDPQAKATISEYATKLRKGPLVKKQLPLGQKETFTYDILGRQTSHTDALNNTTSMTYTVSPTNNLVSSVASNGYRLVHKLDVLGRQIQLLDNGNSPQSSPSEPTRTIYTKTYDSISRITSRTDGTGLVTLYNAYDAFNRVLSVINTDGNVTTNMYDDVNLQMTSAVNGSLRAKTQLDAFNRKVTASKYADSSDTSIDYYITETHEYDGFGKIIKVEHYQEALDQHTSLCLDTTTRTFDVEDNVQVETATSKSDVAENAYDTVKRKFVRDVFGLVYTHSKDIAYSDGRSFHQAGAIYVYDDCKLLIQSQNQIGQKELYAYDDNGWKKSTTRFDGTTIKYTYDDLGRLATIEDSTETETRGYLSNDRLASISVTPSDPSAVKTITYSYSLDGSATAVTYPDNQITSYGLDNVGRIVRQTDVNGVQRNIVFNAQGHVATRSIGNDTVVYTYGTANHTYGQLLQDATTGSKKQLRTLQYDGYGRANQVITIDVQEAAILLSSQYHYNPQNRLQTINMSSSLPNSKQLNCTKTFAYDGFGQLVTEIIAYTDGTKNTANFVYDGNCNLVSKSQNGVMEKRTYNAIGQRTDCGITYDANGKMLTDKRGRQYTYYADDRLQSTDGVIFTYHPDGSLACMTNNDGQTSFYYDNGAVNASNTGNDHTSYQLEPGRRLASYAKSSNASSYYVENNGSTVLTVAPSIAKVSEYGAYGDPTTAAPQGDQFGYRQELVEQSSGLVYLRSRFYLPDHAAFITMDATPKENRYAYCGGDPINRSDGTGHSAGGAMAASIIAGTVTTILTGILTGGAAAFVFGPTSIAASVSAAAVSGAAGNVVSDVVGQAANHQKTNGSSLEIDALAGAVGGAIGAGSGGAAGRLAMEIAEPTVQSVGNVGKIGLAISSVVGGAAGTMSSAGVESLGNGRPMLSEDNALGFVTGALGGIGGGVLTSMSYLPWTRLRVLPVMATEDHFANLHIDTWNQDGVDTNPKTLKSFVSANEHQNDLRAFNNGVLVPNDILRLKHGDGNLTYDTFVIHGQGADVFPAMQRTVNGVMETVLRPMKGKTFAQVLRGMQNRHEFGNNANGSVKALSCHAALFNAKTVAIQLQRNVFGSYKAISGTEPDIVWRERTP